MSDVLQLLADVEKAAIGRVKLVGALESARARIAEAQIELDELEASAAPLDTEVADKYAQLEAAGLPREQAEKLVDDKLKALVTLGLIDAIDADARKPRKRNAKLKEQAPDGGVAPSAQIAPAVVAASVADPAVVERQTATPPAEVTPAVVVEPVVPAAPEATVADPAALVDPVVALETPPAPEALVAASLDSSEDDDELSEVYVLHDDGNGIPAHFDESPHDTVVWDESGSDGDAAEEEAPEVEAPVVEPEAAAVAQAAAARPGMNRAARPSPVVSADPSPAPAAAPADDATFGDTGEAPALAPDPTLGPGPVLSPGDLPDFLLG